MRTSTIQGLVLPSGCTLVTPENARELQRWDEFLATQPEASVYHRTQWQSLVHKTFGHAIYRIAVLDSDQAFQGILPLVHMNSLMFGSFLVSLPFFNYGGIVAATESASRKLRESSVALCRALEASHVELRHVEGITSWPTRTDKVMMLLELAKDEDALWKSLKSKVRAQVKRPVREGAVTQSGGIELLDDFYRVFSENMRDLGTPVYSKAFFAEILYNFPDCTRLFVVYLANKPVAAGLTVALKEKLEIPWASSLRTSNKFGVNMALYWEVLKWAVNNGYRQFNFGRCTPDTGTFKFKKQWGAQPVQLHWEYWLPNDQPLPMLNPSNPKYRFFINLWSKLPVVLANALGPSIVKNIP